MDHADRLSSQCTDLRAMHRHALTLQAAARRRRDAVHARRCHRFIVKCLRALRYAARIEAGWALTGPTDPACSAYVFSELPEKVFSTTAPTVTPVSNRRRTFRERLRRR